MPLRSLEELLVALDVTEASAVLFGVLPATTRETTVKPPPVADVYAAFSEHKSIVVSLEECLVLRTAGAKDGRPVFRPDGNP